MKRISANIMKRIEKADAGLDALLQPLPRHDDDELGRLLDRMVIEYFVNIQTVEDYELVKLSGRLGITEEALNKRIYGLLSRALKQIKLESENNDAVPNTGLLPSVNM